jgi:hypothetical protein
LTDAKLRKLINTCDKIYDSDEYKARRAEQTRFLKYYSGKYWPKQKDDDESKKSEIFANLIFSTVMTIAPMLTDNKPIWSIRARAPQYQPLASVYKAAGDALWCAEEMDSKIYETVMDALVMKNGIIQVGFDPDRRTGGEISIEVVDPRTYFQAPGFDDNWDAPLCGTRTPRSLWWIRKMYPGKGEDVQPDRKDKESGGLDKVVSRVQTLINGKEDHEYMGETATVYVVWMRDDTMISLKTKNEDGPEEGENTKAKKYPNGRLIVCTEKVVLDDKPYPYNHGKPPWVFLYDYIMPHSTFGIGECDQIEGLTLEYNLFLRRFAEHCRKFSKPNWAIPSSMDPDQFKKDFYTGDNAFCFNPGEEKPSQIAPAMFDQFTLQFINGMPTIVQDVSGVTDVSKGMAAKKQRQSAHEITALLETSYTRTRQRVRNLEQFIKRVFVLVVELMQQFYNEERDFSLKNGNNENEWYSIQNTKGFAEKTMKPEKSLDEVMPASGAEPEDEEDKIVKQQWADYEKLMTEVGDEKSVYFPFEIDIETNSTLPMDQQALANLGIQLAQLGHIDTLSLLELLHVPNPERIVERLKEDAAARQGSAQGPPGAPAPAALPTGGQVG